MKFIKIENLSNIFGQPDYKGLDIKKIVPGSPKYKQDGTECIMAVNDDVIIPDEILIITEADYISIKNAYQIEIDFERKTIEQRLQEQQETIDQLTITILSM
jgi:hypothetical protein